MMYSRRLADFLLGSRNTRRAVLEALFSEPGAGIHLRELARRTGYSAPMVAKEIANLVEHDVVVETRRGNTRVLQANMKSPLAADIARIAGRPRRAMRARGARALAMREAGLRRPRTLREAAAWGAALGQRDAMLREFCDEFYGASARARGAMLEEEPPLAPGDARANAYYAAVAEHLALQCGLRVPSWAVADGRFLRQPFFPSGLESLKSTVLVESPPAFRRRMIFVGADPLYRPRREGRR